MVNREAQADRSAGCGRDGRRRRSAPVDLNTASRRAARHAARSRAGDGRRASSTGAPRTGASRRSTSCARSPGSAPAPSSGSRRRCGVTPWVRGRRSPQRRCRRRPRWRSTLAPSLPVPAAALVTALGCAVAALGVLLWWYRLVPAPDVVVVATLVVLSAGVAAWRVGPLIEGPLAVAGRRRGRSSAPRRSPRATRARATAARRARGAPTTRGRSTPSLVHRHDRGGGARARPAGAGAHERRRLHGVVASLLPGTRLRLGGRVLPGRARCVAGRPRSWPSRSWWSRGPPPVQGAAGCRARRAARRRLRTAGRPAAACCRVSSSATPRRRARTSSRPCATPASRTSPPSAAATSLSWWPWWWCSAGSWACAAAARDCASSRSRSRRTSCVARPAAVGGAGRRDGGGGAGRAARSTCGCRPLDALGWSVVGLVLLDPFLARVGRLRDVGRRPLRRCSSSLALGRPRPDGGSVVASGRGARSAPGRGQRRGAAGGRAARRRDRRGGAGGRGRRQPARRAGRRARPRRSGSWPPWSGWCRRPLASVLALPAGWAVGWIAIVARADLVRGSAACRGRGMGGCGAVSR